MINLKLEFYNILNFITFGIYFDLPNSGRNPFFRDSQYFGNFKSSQIARVGEFNNLD